MAPLWPVGFSAHERAVDAARKCSAWSESLKTAPEAAQSRKRFFMLGTVLLVVLVLLLLGALPTWPHSKNWGYGPTGGLGLVVVIIVILLLLGRI